MSVESDLISFSRQENSTNDEPIVVTIGTNKLVLNDKSGNLRCRAILDRDVSNIHAASKRPKNNSPACIEPAGRSHARFELPSFQMPLKEAAESFGLELSKMIVDSV